MRTRLSHVSSAAALFVLFGAVGAARAQTPQYSYTRLQYPGAIYTDATGINNAGTVVGTYFDANGIPHGYTYDGITYTSINFPGAIYNYAFGVSPLGHLVGSHSHTAEAGPYHAFYAQSGSFTEFDYPGMETDARAMNGSGAIIGIYNSGYGTPDHGFLKVGDSYTSIDAPGAATTYVFGLNDAGLVTGTYRDTIGAVRGFTYRDGVYTPVAFPTATETYVAGVNNLNTMVGWDVQAGKVYGFLAPQSGWSFRALNVALPGATNGRPRAINDRNEVVGTFTSVDCPFGCGFVARPISGSLAVCDQSPSLTYQGGTLNVSVTLRTSAQTTWTSWLFTPTASYRLWTTTAPVVANPTTVNVPIAAFPAVGPVYLLSLLSTPTGGVVCSDLAMVNTVAPPK